MMKHHVASLLLACAVFTALFATPELRAATPGPAAAHASAAFWRDTGTAAAPTSNAGAPPSVLPRRYRGATLDRVSLAAALAQAPLEGSAAARQNPLVVALPDPDGGFQRFSVVESPIMEPGLAARHPDIRTYAGRGIDRPGASLRMDLGPLGLHASVRSPAGSWYIDPYYHLDQSLYASYYGRDLTNRHGPLVEASMIGPRVSTQQGFYHAADKVDIRGAGFSAGAAVTLTVRHLQMDMLPRQTLHLVADADGAIAATIVADPYKNLGSYEVTTTEGRATATTGYQVVADGIAPEASVGAQLRTYRLALVTDPSYANYFGGPANVTAAKVALINRVSQVYEYETSIRLVLVAQNDALNLDTAALMTGANGPCGGTACYTAAQASGCSSSTLARNRQVVGLLVGASNYDIGHIGFGLNGGGIASLGVVGGSAKAQGCTGVPTPVGDVFAVDYVAHEMGHQFAGNHTFNGVTGSCSGGNRNPGTSVEPGSGSSIMAYAGICGSDNLQSHSDPYWSQRSFDEIIAYTSGAETNLGEVQMAALTGFNTNGQQFQLRYNGADSAPIVRGSNYTTAGVKAAIEAIAGWPSGGTVAVSALGDTGFTLSFGGSLAGADVANLQLVDCGGCSGYIGEITKGGPTTRNGAVTVSGNHAPVVAAPSAHTIPVRTPFLLAASASDADGDELTYLWEQNDRGAGAGAALIGNAKSSGPLFRQFGTRALVTSDGTLIYDSPGENHATTDPTRVFPDLPQVLANNTNAESGACPAVAGAPTGAQTDCYSEYLPTASYTGYGVNASPASLNFRVTVRDGRGGVDSASTRLVLAPAAGPFLVTWPNTAMTLAGGSTQAVIWDVANTDADPVNVASVRISLSTDGGVSWPYVLASSTANNGSRAVTLPNVATNRARVKVEAVGNVFFDVSNADFTIQPASVAGDVNGDGVVDCADLAVVKSSFGRHSGQPGFDSRADVNSDGVVDIRDLAYVARHIAAGTACR